MWPFGGSAARDMPTPITPSHIRLDKRPLLEPSRPRHTIRNFLKSSWRISVIGGFLFLLAVAGESAREQIAPGSTALEVGELIFEHIFTLGFFFRFLGEVGIAFIIAAVVAASVEATARREQTDAFEQAIQLMGESVIEGVYRIRHDKEYVKAVISSCLAVRYVRKDVVIAYDVTELTPEECEKYGVSVLDFVRVDVEFTYQAFNITQLAGEFPGVYTIPARQGALADLARLKFLNVEGTEYSAAEIEEIEVKPGEPDYNASDKTWRFGIPTVPNVGASVRILAEFIKERSDTEIFAFLLPTARATIRFNFRLEGISHVSAKARTATPMREPPKPYGKQVEWTVPGALMPNNHVAVWWVTDPSYIEARTKGLPWTPPVADDTSPRDTTHSPSALAAEAVGSSAQESQNASDTDETALRGGLHSLGNLAKRAFSRLRGGTRSKRG